MDALMLQDLLYLYQIACFHDDLKVQIVFFQIILSGLDRFPDTSTEVDMVVLEHDHVVEGETVVLASPDLHRPFLQGPNSGCGFTCVQNLGTRTFQLLYIDGGLGCNGIKHQAFCLKDALRASLYDKRHISMLHLTTILQ